jgi:Na+/phosphate symporter
MKTNVGSLDKLVRVALAVVFAILYFTHTVEGTLGTILLALGAVFLATALMGTCPLYSIFGISTCPVKKA